MARDVFISYCKEDSVHANRLCSLLESDGISCWMAPRDVPPGQEWPAAIAAGIRRSHVLLLLLSTHSQRSKQIAREVEMADKNGLSIVTFRVEDVAPPANLEYFLNNLQWIDGFREQFELAERKVAETIRRSDQFPATSTIYPTQKLQSPANDVELPKPLITERLPDSGKSSRIVKLAIAGLLLASVLGGSAYYWLNPGRKKEKADAAFKSGLEAAQRGDNKAALANFQRALALNPSNPQVLDHRAEVYHRQGRDDLALLDVKQATQTGDNGDTGIHLLNADVWKLLRQYPEAVQEYDKFLSSHPRDQQATEAATQARNEVLDQISLRETSEDWLRQWDNGSPGGIWTSHIPQRTKELGNIRQRRFERCEKVLDNKYHCYYDSSFNEAPSVTEEVVLIRAGDGKWKPSGYGYHHK